MVKACLEQGRPFGIVHPRSKVGTLAYVEDIYTMQVSITSAIVGSISYQYSVGFAFYTMLGTNYYQSKEPLVMIALAPIHPPTQDNGQSTDQNDFDIGQSL
jgi:hypothetical protein